MPSLSFDSVKGSRPIAIAKGGEFHDEILYLHEDDDKAVKRPKGEISAVRYTKEMSAVPSRDRVKVMNRLNEALRKGLSADDLVGETDTIRELYAKMKKDSEGKGSIALPDDSSFQLIPSPDPKKREIFYICGASGSGKSYIAKGLAESYKKLHPGREVYLISKLEEDSTIDKAKPKRINAQTLVDDYPSIEEFQDCMVIFDDIDCFDGKVLKAVHQLIDDIAITGRHTNTTMLFLTHFITNYKKTRLVLNEATHYVVYPQSTSYHALGYLLKTHVGMTKDDVRDLRKLGRWVCICKNYPQTLLSEHTAKILHQE